MEQINLEHNGKKFILVHIKETHTESDGFLLYDNEEAFYKEQKYQMNNRKLYISKTIFRKQDLHSYRKNGKPHTKTNAWFLGWIGVSDEYRGQKLGLILLKTITNILNISNFYLESTKSAYNRWCQLGIDTGYKSYDCPLIYISNSTLYQEEQ